MRFAAFVPPQADKQPVATQASTLKNACSKAGVPLTLRMHAGYDHSYFFISSFIEYHLRWHAQRLGITTAR
jgi:S-formylglutathione hydrolase FrmB